jgi:hypothetical protein
VKHTFGRVAVATLVGVILFGGWTTFRIWQVGNQDDPRDADAIVVLGAAQYNGRPSAILKARLDHGIDLFDEGGAR